VRVVWTPEAQQDRVDLWGYIAAENPRAAARMDELFRWLKADREQGS